MPSDRTPLLAASRRSVDSARSDERAEAEDNAIRGASPNREGWSSRLREIILFIWALLATAVIIVLAAMLQHNQTTGPLDKPVGKRNLIFMVSDGMGPATLSLTRSYRQLVDGLEHDDTLTLDKHFWGTSRTRSSNRLVTDSAAGATAFSCGEKTYNGAISVLPDFSPCGSVMEAAKEAGYKTGLVVTTDITDATPACFASHVNLREQENEIALQEIGEGPLGRVVDIMLGGGRCHFLPNTTEGSCRADDVNVAHIAQEKHGWTYLDSRAGFDDLHAGENVSLPLMGLFAGNDVPFEIDRRNMADVYPSLSEMATTALRALELATKDSDYGFFLMIEGSRIDHAGHFNDPAAQVREVLEYDKTFKAVVDFIEESKTESLLVATSDHETGGLSTAWQSQSAELPVYNWYPSVLAKTNASNAYLTHKLHEYLRSIKSDPAAQGELEDWINTNLVIPGLGITNARDFELKKLASDPAHAINTFSKMISQRARIGWSTRGHSAIDVNIYSSGGPYAEDLHGNVENTEIGKFLRKYLSVSTDTITQELKEKMDWGPSLAGVSPDDAMAQMGIEMEEGPVYWLD
ncbi:alkaline phosphatase-like protein [Cryphonectria parasitica EP155]|uniref:Alkaline phosphatase n=1 Tax=Cryphonectria parasitica (strain ATCC 38755 / EP155) TaxID=660469 RepID=A0A9P5CTE9_CRYP1|nr:alkaline phosphatase-like protein [Cryphonectria parasitica EP155]KAF3770268.1 alkaline phosphatase-like protein [Cryphonectria parasitica EP155]